MKVAVLLIEGAKQIMLTPETDLERSALKMIDPDSKIIAQSKWGAFSDVETVGTKIDKCQGGYYRAYEDKESLILLIEQSDKKSWEILLYTNFYLM